MGSRTKGVFDLDIFVYRCGFAAQKTIYEVYGETTDGLSFLAAFDSGNDYKEYVAEKGLEEYQIHRVVEPEPASHAVNGLKLALGAVGKDLGLGWHRGYLSRSGPTFREQIATAKPYKGNRVAQKPVHYDLLRDWLIKRFPNTHWAPEGLEADDMIAIELTRDPELINISIDKDLWQVPGAHFDFVHGQLNVVDEATANRLLYQQVISGDATDNIPGLPGMGTKKAEKALAEVEPAAEELYNAVLEVYRGVAENRFGDPAIWRYTPFREQEEVEVPVEQYLHEQARLVYLLRHEEDFWQPPVED